MDYVGSITIDTLLMKAANLLPYEMVQVTSLRNATRWKTYALPGAEGTGTICLNGPPAHLFQPGDLVIILSMGMYGEDELLKLVPKVVFVDGHNRIERVEPHPLFGEREEVNWSALVPDRPDGN